MHELTSDFYTVGDMPGHMLKLKGIGIHLGISTNLDAVTKQIILNIDDGAKFFVKNHF